MVSAWPAAPPGLLRHALGARGRDKTARPAAARNARYEFVHDWRIGLEQVVAEGLGRALRPSVHGVCRAVQRRVRRMNSRGFRCPAGPCVWALAARCRCSLLSIYVWLHHQRARIACNTWPACFQTRLAFNAPIAPSACRVLYYAAQRSARVRAARCAQPFAARAPPPTPLLASPACQALLKLCVFSCRRMGGRTGCHVTLVPGSPCSCSVSMTSSRWMHLFVHACKTASVL